MHIIRRVKRGRRPRKVETKVCPHCGSVLVARHEPEERELTPRQLEIIRLAAHGLTAKEIAAELKVSPRTVEFHRAAAMQRLGVKTTVELARYATQHKLV
jgi:DNA-binding NarL/FixJ family response regulator